MGSTTYMEKLIKKPQKKQNYDINYDNTDVNKIWITFTYNKTKKNYKK